MSKKGKSFWDVIMEDHEGKKRICKNCGNPVRLGDWPGSVICDECQSAYHWSFSMESDEE